MSVPRTRGFHRETGDKIFWFYSTVCLPDTWPEGSQTPRLTSEAQECWFWLPDTVPENSGSHLVISLSDRLGRAPIVLTFSSLLSGVAAARAEADAGLAPSTKCSSGTAPGLISRSALRNFRVYGASFHNWLHHSFWGQCSCCDSRFHLYSDWDHGCTVQLLETFCMVMAVQLMNAKVGFPCAMSPRLSLQ